MINLPSETMIDTYRAQAQELNQIGRAITLQEGRTLAARIVELCDAYKRIYADYMRIEKILEQELAASRRRARQHAALTEQQLGDSPCLNSRAYKPSKSTNAKPSKN